MWADGDEAVVGYEKRGSDLVTIGDVVTKTAASNDLTEISLAVNDFFSRWDSTDRLLLLFDLISALIDSVSETMSHRFLHILSGQVKDVDVLAYYQMDPASLESQQRTSLAYMFDEVVEIRSELSE